MMGVEAAVSSNDFLNFIFYETISAANPYFSTQHDHQSNHFNSLVEETLRVFPPPPPPPPPLPLPLPHPHPQEIENFCGNHSFNNTRIPHPQEIENFCGNHSFNNTRSSITTSSSSAVLLRRLNSKNIGGGSGGGGSGGGGKKKRRRKARVCKNKQEAETQRMTHIAVERNRRKQMNEHLAVLRSLMPDSYAQRGDQASIVGGAIEFVKEQEHLLQSLEAKKFQLLHGLVSTSSGGNHDHDHQSSPSSNDDDNNKLMMMMDIPEPEPKPKPDSMMKAPFAHFFVYPQYTWCQSPNPMNKMYQGGGKSSSTRASIADIEVTLIETHANVRIMTRISRNQATTTRQLSRLVAGFQALHLTILHVNLTTIAPLLVLYSISAKLEEGCQLTSVDDIAGAVHHMIGIIVEEDDICPAGFI